MVYVVTWNTLENSRTSTRLSHYAECTSEYSLELTLTALRSTSNATDIKIYQAQPVKVTTLLKIDLIPDSE